MSEQEPKRSISQELTAVIPRDHLAPISTQMMVAVDHSEDDEWRDRPTMVPCPACAECPCCKGQRLVTVDQAAEWDAKQKPSPDDAA